jgi:hypothetical protein
LCCTLCHFQGAGIKQYKKHKGSINEKGNELSFFKPGNTAYIPDSQAYRINLAF